jgi:hypothetical protein
MKVYTAHSKTAPSGDLARDTDRLVFVKDGFSIWAAVFPFLWFVINRMWIPLLAYLALSIGFRALAQGMGLSDGSIFPIAVVLGLLIGFEANSLHRWSLSAKGYRLVSIGSGTTREECERRVYEKLVDAADKPPMDTRGPSLGSEPIMPPTPTTKPAPIVGLFPEPGR